MAKCFCGCGRTIRFRGRVGNNYGKTALQFLSELEAASTLDPEDEGTVAFLDQGRVWRRQFASAAHGEIGMNSLDRDDWLRWRNAAFEIIRQDHAALATLGKQVMASGLTPKEFAEKTVTEASREP